MKNENSNLPRLVDSHTHTQFAAFNEDYREVIDRALADDIWLINVGTQKDTSLRAVEIAEKYPEGVYATIGLHPIHTEKSFHDKQEVGGDAFSSREEIFDYDFYKKLGEHPKVLAIGECGFDFYRQGAAPKGGEPRPDSSGREETKDKQEKAFIAQIELAHELKKPLMIHCRPGAPGRTSPQNGAGRSAYPDLIKILDTRYMILNNPAGIIHFFSGTKEDARKLLDLGFYFSFGGVITFVRDYDEVIKLIELERIVLETDAPYVTPAPHRGKRNEPVYVNFVAEKLAEVLNKDLEEVAGQTTKNALNVFNLGTSDVPNIAST